MNLIREVCNGENPFIESSNEDHLVTTVLVSFTNSQIVVVNYRLSPHDGIQSKLVTLGPAFSGHCKQVTALTHYHLTKTAKRSINHVLKYST